jgi:YVTN family beta-propeller protein
LPDSSRPFALCYNLPANKVYCANYGSDNVTVIDRETDSVLVTIGVGDGPGAFCYNPQQNRVYVANTLGSSISVLRDSMPSGIEESLKPQASSSRPAATVVRGLPPGTVVFDAMGRSVANPGPGVYFVREQSAFSSQYSGWSAASGERSAVSVWKVILQR